jgi:hypothetical protein
LGASAGADSTGRSEVVIIGNGSEGQSGLDGLISDVRIYRRELPVEEIRSIDPSAEHEAALHAGGIAPISQAQDGAPRE